MSLDFNSWTKHTLLILVKKLMVKMLNLKLQTLLEYQKPFCKKLSSKLVRGNLLIKKVKNTVPWTYVINDLKEEEIVGNLFWKRIAKNKSKRV